tara:strand:- start:474 stop:611 length:138 start_codon:yes stop_codon:yes gene_type:complete
MPISAFPDVRLKSSMRSNKEKINPTALDVITNHFIKVEIRYLERE